MKSFTIALVLSLQLTAFNADCREISKISRQTIDTSDWFSLRCELFPGERIEILFPAQPEPIQNDSSINFKATDSEGMTFGISTLHMTEENIIAFGYKMAQKIDNTPGQDILYCGPIRENAMSLVPTEEERANACNANTGYMIAWTDEQGTMTRLTLFKGKETVYVLTCQAVIDEHHTLEMFKSGGATCIKCNAFTRSFSIDFWQKKPFAGDPGRDKKKSSGSRT